MEISNQTQGQEVPTGAPKPTTTPNRRGMLLWAALAAIVVITTALVAYLLSQNNNTSSSAVNSGASVKISADEFTPATVKIKKGQTVTWVNDDSQPHQIMADPYPSGDSLPDLNSQESLNQNDSYTATFDKTGTFTYHDQLNPSKLKATIIVE